MITLNKQIPKNIIIKKTKEKPQTQQFYKHKMSEELMKKLSSVLGARNLRLIRQQN